jgi:hypothetical protein
MARSGADIVKGYSHRPRCCVKPLTSGGFGASSAFVKKAGTSRFLKSLRALGRMSFVSATATPIPAIPRWPKDALRANRLTKRSD